jgi:predicted butyrate kinase (DUF1464 family)
VIVFRSSISFKFSSIYAEKKIETKSIKKSPSRAKPKIVYASYPASGVALLAKAISTGVIKHEINRTNIMKSSQTFLILLSG